MKAVRALSRQDTPPPAEPHTISLRCCGQSPSGLPAEPRGKDWIAPTTSLQDTCRPCSGLVGMVVASMSWGEVLGVCAYEQTVLYRCLEQRIPQSWQYGLPP